MMFVLQYKQLHIVQERMCKNRTHQTHRWKDYAMCGDRKPLEDFIVRQKDLTNGELKKSRSRSGKAGSRTMKVIKNIFWLFVVLAAIGWLWQVLEMVFYGVIQPRKVDEIISFVWAVVVVMAYKKGRRDVQGQEERG